jgi:hypothetical protein
MNFPVADIPDEASKPIFDLALLRDLLCGGSLGAAECSDERVEPVELLGHLEGSELPDLLPIRRGEDVPKRILLETVSGLHACGHGEGRNRVPELDDPPLDPDPVEPVVPLDPKAVASPAVPCTAPSPATVAVAPA